MIKNSKTSFDDVPMVAKIAHELKNPIHGTKSICEVLLDAWDSFDDEMKKSSIEIMHKSLCDLEDLVNKLFEPGKDVS